MEFIEQSQRGIKRPHDSDVSDNKGNFNESPVKTETNSHQTGSFQSDAELLSTPSKKIKLESPEPGKVASKDSCDSKTPSPVKKQTDEKKSQHTPNVSPSKSPSKSAAIDEHTEEYRTYIKNKKEKQEKERQKMQ